MKEGGTARVEVYSGASTEDSGACGEGLEDSEGDEGVQVARVAPEANSGDNCIEYCRTQSLAY